LLAVGCGGGSDVVAAPTAAERVPAPTLLATVFLPAMGLGVSSGRLSTATAAPFDAPGGRAAVGGAGVAAELAPAAAAATVACAPAPPARAGSSPRRVASHTAKRAPATDAAPTDARTATAPVEMRRSPPVPVRVNTGRVAETS
jgi:hypothetical protein